jgi:hypothetical protein
MIRPMTTVSRALAAVVALLVLVRVVVSSATSLGSADEPVVVVATALLLVAAVALVVTAGAYAAAGGAVRWFGTAWLAHVVVMSGYLVIGLALGRSVPWTAYAVLGAVALLGGAALATRREG